MVFCFLLYSAKRTRNLFGQSHTNFLVDNFEMADHRLTVNSNLSNLSACNPTQSHTHTHTYFIHISFGVGIFSALDHLCSVCASICIYRWMRRDRVQFGLTAVVIHCEQSLLMNARPDSNALCRKIRYTIRFGHFPFIVTNMQPQTNCIQIYTYSRIIHTRTRWHRHDHFAHRSPNLRRALALELSIYAHIHVAYPIPMNVLWANMREE